MGRKIIYNQEARARALYGMKQVFDAVRITYGPLGRTAAIQVGNNMRITKDGISLIKSIEFADKTVDLGAIMMKEASGKANFQSGDGSTSTAMLTYSMCRSANSILNRGVDINELRTGYNQALLDTLNYLETFRIQMPKEVEDFKKQIFNIALVSANGDKEIAENVVKAFLAVGDGGVVSYGESTSVTGKTEVVVNKGVEYRQGFASSKCANNVTFDKCILNDVDIILYGDTVKDMTSLNTIIEKEKFNQRSFLIMAPNYDQTEVFPQLACVFDKYKNGAFMFVPGTSAATIRENMADIQQLTSAKAILTDVDPNDFDVENDVGHCNQVVLTQNTCLLIEPSYAPTFDDYVDKLEAELTKDDAVNGISQGMKDVLKKRIGNMTGGIATIYIGSISTMDISEKKDRYEDALNAVRGAIEGGYLVGGSSSLMKISAMIKAPRKFSTGEREAYDAFARAIRIPCCQLIESAGLLVEDVAVDIKKTDKTIGFNAKTGEIEDLVERGIIDPYKVIYNSLRYSHNVALQFAALDVTVVSDEANLKAIPIDSLIQEDRVVE